LHQNFKELHLIQHNITNFAKLLMMKDS